MRFQTLAPLLLAAMALIPSPCLGQALIQNIVAGAEPLNETTDVHVTRFGDFTAEPSVSIGMRLEAGDLLASVSGKTDLELECAGGGIFRLTGHYRVVINSHEATDCRIDLFSGRVDAMTDESAEVNMGGVVMGTEGTEFWAALERSGQGVVRKIGVLDGAVILEAQRQSGYSVLLTGAGANRIEVIKVIREVSGLGLRESKELLEETPAFVVSGLAEHEANALVSKLQAAGAEAEVRKPLQSERLKAGRRLQMQPDGVINTRDLSKKEISNIAQLRARFDVSQAIRAGVVKPEEKAALQSQFTSLHYEVLAKPEDKSKRLELGTIQASYKLNNQAFYQIKRADGLNKETLQHYKVDPKLLREGLSPNNIKKLNDAKIVSHSSAASQTTNKPSAPNDVKIVSPAPAVTPTITKSYAPVATYQPVTTKLPATAELMKVMDSGDYKTALAGFQKRDEAKKAGAEDYYGLAMSSYHLGNTDNARRYAKQALELHAKGQKLPDKALQACRYMVKQ